MLMNNTLFDILQLLLLGSYQRSRWQRNSRRILRRILRKIQMNSRAIHLVILAGILQEF